jgi:TPR repeat protein
MNTSLLFRISALALFLLPIAQNVCADSKTETRLATVKRIDELNRRAADGDYYATQELRILSRKGVGKAVDYVNVYDLQKRIDKDPGDTNALCRLGQAYLYEHGCVTRDVDKSKKLFYASAEHGGQDAMWELGSMHCWPVDGVAQDLHEAEKWFKKLDSMGDGRGSFALGWMGMYCDGGNVNDTIAYFEKSVARGHPRGAMHLGLIYSNGKLVKADQDKAFEYYSKAVDMGIPEAAYFAAEYYYKTPLNDGSFKKDKKKAVQLLEYALREGDDATRSRILDDFREDTRSTKSANSTNRAKNSGGGSENRKTLSGADGASSFLEHVNIRNKQRDDASSSKK